MKASRLTNDHILTKIQDAQISAVAIRISDNLQLHSILVKTDVCWLKLSNTSLVGKSVYLSGAALDYLFTKILDTIENAAMAWKDMIKYSQR
jgi:hypothetical protein